MGFDPAKVPGDDVAAWGAQCREKALAGLEAGDWKAVHDWTRSWVGWGGGAWIPDTWLLYAVSALGQGKPRIAVHSIDLGLKYWLPGPIDQAVLAWCRGVIVMDRLGDPKTALIDLEAAAPLLPVWLAPAAAERLARCREEAAKSRKRTPSVKPRPEFTGPDPVLDSVAPPAAAHHDGDKPSVWETVATFFAGKISTSAEGR
ncbi:hypothetical protein GCM10023346_25200 [Arthrobacter gyeryongensis]|uniref:Uncharacterized protein n=1 Tax=Arthrobacter gyeryongensis TaxID=1650592 RepID=A0ABP9SIS3_9MICC